MTTAKPFVPSKPRASSLQRPHFSPGLLLEDEDLNVAVKYTQELMRLMLKSLFGCGVVCGLKVTAKPTCQDTKRQIDVARGIALDCQGNLIEVPEPWSYEFGPDCDDGFPENVWVVVCYHENCCRPKDVTCSHDDEGQSAPTRIRSGYEIKLYDRLPDCACRCRSEDDEEEAAADGKSHSCCNEPTVKRSRVKKSTTLNEAGGEGEEEEEEEETEEECPCYSDHYHGVCDCECGCKCVLLGKVVDLETIIREDENGNPLISPIIEVDDTMVRRVRPVLNGYLECRFPEDESRHTVAYRRLAAMAAGDQTRQETDAARRELLALRQSAKERQREREIKEEKAKTRDAKSKDEKA